ncbi:hypothetical protein D623_10011692 [Myotis brandtii]|uniref:Uncharacterized protein n=1 Tax=Myotis brandtii TaxID=109478 RepID=S7NSR0_MYOBR|nr:hypothetical protein D623_10011692 [Myotis brandtii]
MTPCPLSHTSQDSAPLEGQGQLPASVLGFPRPEGRCECSRWERPCAKQNKWENEEKKNRNIPHHGPG